MTYDEWKARNPADEELGSAEQKDVLERAYAQINALGGIGQDKPNDSYSRGHISGFNDAVDRCLDILIQLGAKGA